MWQASKEHFIKFFSEEVSGFQELLALQCYSLSQKKDRCPFSRKTSNMLRYVLKKWPVSRIKKIVELNVEIRPMCLKITKIGNNSRK